MGNWQWLLDLVVAVLLAATLLRAYRLDRALAALRRDRSAFEALMAEFDRNAREARGGIDTLRQLTDGSAERIDRQSHAALALRDDLARLVERGEQAAERLDHGLRVMRALVPPEPWASAEPARRPSPVVAARAAASAAGGVDAGVAGGAAAARELAPEFGRVRSKAERDLLIALQAGR